MSLNSTLLRVLEAICLHWHLHIIQIRYFSSFNQYLNKVNAIKKKLWAITFYTVCLFLPQVETYLSYVVESIYFPFMIRAVRSIMVLKVTMPPIVLCSHHGFGILYLYDHEGTAHPTRARTPTFFFSTLSFFSPHPYTTTLWLCCKKVQSHLFSTGNHFEDIFVIWQIHKKRITGLHAIIAC